MNKNKFHRFSDRLVDFSMSESGISLVIGIEKKYYCLYLVSLDSCLNPFLFLFLFFPPL